MDRRQFVKHAGCAAATALVSPFGWTRQVQRAGPDLPVRKPAPTIAFHSNQVGYLPNGRKRATVFAAASRAKVISLPGGEVFRGSVFAQHADPLSGDTVGVFDFSAVKNPGNYSLELEFAGGSYGFSIGDDVYAELLRSTLRSYYGQRCGCAVDLGDGYSHEPCHPNGAFHRTSGREGKLPNSGGWHDAGDYGRYVVNSGITTGTLLWAWELYGKLLKKLDLKIPRSRGKMPDFLAEVRWNLAWMLQMQDADGGVWHKQTSEDFAAMVMPERDPLVSYVIGTGTAPFKSTAATANLVAVAAIAARVYGRYDDRFAAQCLDAARRGWSWCQQHPAVLFRNPPGIATGEYGDGDCADELLWAAAELWRTSGGEEHRRFLESEFVARPPQALRAPGWNSVGTLGWLTLVLSERKGLSPDILEKVRAAAIAGCVTLAKRGRASAYGHTLAAEDYVWGSNGVTANQGLLLLIGERLQPRSGFRDAAQGNLDYLLGRNCFGLSWVTHAGTRWFQQPHHRPSMADANPHPWPGLLSGGPNARPSDPIAKDMPLQPPMRMYMDHDGSWSTNEVAINWNAPLVFLLAGLSQ